MIQASAGVELKGIRRVSFESSPRMPEEMEKLVDVYLRGREQSTMKSYESSFRSSGRLCEECGLSVKDRLYNRYSMMLLYQGLV